LLSHALLAETNGLNAVSGEWAMQYLTEQLYGATNPSQLSENQKQTLVALSADGTRNAKLVTQFSDGNLSSIKSSTLFPESWTSNQTMSAVKQVGDLPPVATRADGATLYQSTVNGVKIEVIKVGNNVTAAYPCGRGCTSPTTFAEQ
jgi:filamentous hemagglutinin